MTPNTISVTNTGLTCKGLTFLVRLVRRGDRYGLDDCKTHDGDDPLVEFYDARHPHTEYGQFVSRYHRSTLLNPDRFHVPPRARAAICSGINGLNLHSGVADWSVDGHCMDVVREWLDASIQLD